VKALRFLLVLTLCVAFIAAVAFSVSRRAPENLIGAGIIAIGALAVMFSSAIATAQNDRASRAPSFINLRALRPLTITLWGIGMAVVGLAWAFVY
jgi:hypothetical protein